MSKRKRKRAPAAAASAPPPSANAADLRSTRRRRVVIWFVPALAALALGGLLIYFATTARKTELPASPVAANPAPSPAPTPARHVGAQKCTQCHATEYKAWRGSHHELAMREAGAETVLGNFDDAHFRGDGMEVGFFRRDGKYWIRAEGADGKPGDFEVKYTFGIMPLQQYLLELPGGKLQAFTVAWDTRPKEKAGSAGSTFIRARNSATATNCTGAVCSRTGTSCARTVIPPTCRRITMRPN